MYMRVHARTYAYVVVGMCMRVCAYTLVKARIGMYAQVLFMEMYVRICVLLCTYALVRVYV